MANSIATITKYMTSALDTVLATESKTAILERNQAFVRYDFKNARIVKILDMVMDGLSNYYRGNTTTADSGRTNYNASGVHGDGYKVGNVKETWTDYPMTYDRGRQFQIDEMDDEETAGLTIGNILKEFVRTQIVPEIDATRFAIIAGNTYKSLGNKVVETPTANDIYDKFVDGFTWLSNHEVPSEDQVLFINPSINALLQKSDKLTRFISQGDFKSERGIDFRLKAFDGRALVEVPQSRFMTEISLTDNGFAPSAGAKAINYMICSKRCVVPVVKLYKTKIFGPEVNQDFDGYKVNVRLYHDCFIPKNKVIGSYVSVSTTEAKAVGNVLNVALKKTSVADTYHLVAHYTQPAGKLGRVIWGASAFTLGATASGSQLNNVVADGADFKVGTSATKAFFALVDDSNTIIATSAEVALNNLD